MITNIEKLPYPMFKTTPEEKQELLRIFDIFHAQYNEDIFGFDGICSACTLDSLNKKINVSLSGAYLHDVIEFYQYLNWRCGPIFCVNCNHRLRCQIKALYHMIWISKLLEYK